MTPLSSSPGVSAISRAAFKHCGRLDADPVHARGPTSTSTGMVHLKCSARR